MPEPATAAKRLIPEIVCCLKTIYAAFSPQRAAKQKTYFQVPITLIGGRKMTTQTAISSVHKLAIGCGLVTGAALIALPVFSVQAARAKKEHQDYDARVIQPERQKWQSVTSTPAVGQKIEPLPSLPAGIFDEESRLAIALSVLRFRRDVALNAGITFGILSALMFAYHGALKKRVPIQPPQTTTGSDAPGRV